MSAVPLPSIKAERVVIYCLGCGRSTWAAAYVIEAAFGYLPYGFITGRLHCRSGCGDRYATVLPIDAPTPRMFADKYGTVPPIKQKPKAEDRITAQEEYLPCALIEIGKGGTIQKVHARAVDDAILHWGFDYLLSKTMPGRVPPHLAVTRGSQWSRDSLRDFRVVASGEADNEGSGCEAFTAMRSWDVATDLPTSGWAPAWDSVAHMFGMPFANFRRREGHEMRGTMAECCERWLGLPYNARWGVTLTWHKENTAYSWNAKYIAAYVLRNGLPPAMAERRGGQPSTDELRVIIMGPLAKD